MSVIHLEQFVSKQKLEDDLVRLEERHRTLPALYNAALAHYELVNSSQLKTYITYALSSLQREYDLNGIILYLPDHADRKLKFFYGVGTRCDVDWATQNIELKYDLPTDDEGPFAAHAFWSQQFIQENADTSAKFDKKTREIVGVHGPTVGIPLRLSARCFGVLVCWADEGIFTPSLVQRSILHSKMIASLVAATQARRRKFVIAQSINETIRQIGCPNYHEVVFQNILSASLLCGFDRVRLFIFDQEKDNFIWTHAASNHPKGETFYNESIESSTHYTDNPYLRYLFPTNCGIGFLSPGNFLPQDKTDTYEIQTNAVATLFTDEFFGEDPNSELVKREQSLPWAVSPLLYRNLCVGYIAADNKYSNGAIDTESMQHLAFFGFLGGAALVRGNLDDPLIGAMVERYISTTMVIEPLNEPSPRLDQHDLTKSAVIHCALEDDYLGVIEGVELEVIADNISKTLNKKIESKVSHLGLIKDLFSEISSDITQGKPSKKDEEQWYIELPVNYLMRIFRYAANRLTIGSLPLGSNQVLSTAINVHTDEGKYLVLRINGSATENDLKELYKCRHEIAVELRDILACDEYEDLLKYYSYADAKKIIENNALDSLC